MERHLYILMPTILVVVSELQVADMLPAAP